MKKLKWLQRIHWKFITIYTLLLLIAMQLIGAYFNQALETHYVNNYTRMLDQQANLLAYSIQDDLEEPFDFDSEEVAQRYASMHTLIDKMFVAIPHAEVQVLNRNGVVVSTNSANQAIIGQQNTQTEVKRALLGTREESIRLHPKTGHRMKIVSLPIKVGGEVVGAIYLMASMEETYETVKEINSILATGTVITLGLTAIIGVVLARTISSPIKEMTQQTTAMAAGDFSKKVKVYGQDEIGQLAQGINHLSDQLSHALSDNEKEKKKLASILFYMSDGVIATDHKGKIILMNQKAEIMLNKKESHVLGRKISEVLDFPTEVKQDTLMVRDGRFLMDLEADGHPFILQISISPLQRGGHTQGVIAVLQDVTDQVNIERERKEFVANVSHELRTPLTTMKSYVETLNSGTVDDPEVEKKFMNVIENETERMIRLVNDLLQLSKMDTKSLSMNLEETNIESFLLNVINRFSLPLKQRELTLDLNIQENLPLINVDQDQINQVLDNIISNAIKYSLAESNITIDVSEEDNDLKITISDEGVGIPKAELKHIFKRFYRVDKARSRDMGGTGLGLSIAREMIIAHRGSIEIDSDIGQGTTVTIRLPINQGKEGDQAC